MPLPRYTGGTQQGFDIWFPLKDLCLLRLIPFGVPGFSVVPPTDILSVFLSTYLGRYRCGTGS